MPNLEPETATRPANDWWPAFTEAEYERRRRTIREAMRAQGIDCLLIYGAPTYYGTDPGCQNLIYLASYGPGYQGYVVLPREGDPTLLIHVGLHLENARALSVVKDVRAGADIVAVAAGRLQELGCANGTIGIVGNFGLANTSIPLEHYRALTGRLPQAEFRIVTDWYEELRLLKSAEEVAFMEKGAAICDQAFEAFRAVTRPGVTDGDIHNEALRVVHQLGGRTAFGHVQSTPMRDPAMCYPNFYPVNRVVRAGDVLMTELSAGYGGYFGKLFATVFVGEPTREYREMFELAAEAYHQLHVAIKPGGRGRDIEPALRGRAAELGYRPLSRVIGWSTYNTLPSLRISDWEAADLDYVFEPGLCLNIAGYVGTTDGRAAAWVGDTSIVTEDGLRPLQHVPLDRLDYLTIAG